MAEEEKVKRVLKSSMEEDYLILPDKAESFLDIFQKSMIYGRARAHYMWLDRTDEDNSKKAEIDGRTVQGVDPTGFAVGGSMIWKTAPLAGLSATLGYYVANDLGVIDDEDIALGKSGKDTFDRRKYTGRDGNTHYESNDLYVMAQSYAQYHLGKTDIRGGRQIFESFLTASNDTKMIPNTFLGASVVSQDLPQTTVKAGWFAAQKLRDHNTFHDVILVDGWHENDDSGSHVRYTEANGGKKGHDLMVLGATNKSVKDLQLDFWVTGVTDLFYSVMSEANYTIKLTDDLSITPGARYFRQYDEGIDDVTMNGQTAAQIDAFDHDDVINGRADAYLYALRLVGAFKDHKLTLGYHNNSQNGDVIAPWRGFPTGGYTRTTGEVNWTAGTKAEYASWAWKITKAFRTVLSAAKNNRSGDNTNTTIWQGDFIYSFRKDLEGKIKLMSHDGWGESDYDEARFEVNWLF
ncbi:MAG: OprD family outer membrane porin [Thermodesulfobacteriota bacterium]